MGNGELIKLKFTAYSDNEFKKRIKSITPYFVMINPESFKRQFVMSHDEKQAKGSTSSSGKHNKTSPEKYSFEFIVDGTGVLDGNEIDVAKNIEHFLQVVYSYNSDKHCPPFVQIEYCGLIFKCVLTSLDISYNLFHPDSRPLRAKISCSFSSVVNQKVEAMMLDKKSPDITHKRMVTDSTSLIAMANEIYENNNYYVDVAMKNNLNNFRRIKPGTFLYFPPLKK